MAPIKISGLRKSYGRITTLHGIDLEIADGEFVVILGPSGCGKSTLLRMIAGLESVTSGEIAIGGRVVNQLEPRARGCAMVFQNYALYPHMTVAENIGYGLKVAGVAKAERRARVERVAATLGLGDYLDRRPAALSGGQRQRVAMGRAMIREPAVFLFDEPLSNLDAKLRVQMRLEIRRLHQRLKATSIFVTHDQVEAMTLADRLIILNKGQVEQIGTPKEVYDQPASRFVADFIGSPPMNLYDGRQASPAQDAIIGFRPEDATIAHGPGPDRRLFTTEMTEDLGAHLLVHGRIDDIDTVLALPPTIRPAAGDQLWVEVTDNKLHYFDHSTGRRISAKVMGTGA